MGGYGRASVTVSCIYKGQGPSHQVYTCRAGDVESGKHHWSHYIIHLLNYVTHTLTSGFILGGKADGALHPWLYQTAISGVL